MGLTILWFLFKILFYAILFILVYNIYVVLRYFQIYKFHLKHRGINYPLLPFVGNSYVALFNKSKLNILDTFLWIKKRYGMPFTVWLGNNLHYISDNAEEARIILNHPKCLDKAKQYDGLKHLFGNSVILLPGEEWKKRRRFLRAAFKSNMLKTFMPIFNEESHILNDKILNLHPSDDLFKFFSVYSFRIFFLTALGRIDGISEDEVEVFGSYVDSYQDEFAKLLLYSAIPISIWMKIPPGKKLRNNLIELDKLMKHMLLKKKQSITTEYKDNTNNTILLDLILDINCDSEDRDKDIFEELSFFAAAAADTTGHTFVFCCILLGMHPDLQNKLYEEVTTVLGDSSEITESQLNQLFYTEAVLKESQRLLPPVPFFGRYITEDIDIGTKVIPKGSNFIVSALHIHRSPEYWKDPLKFDPTRFLPENASKIIPYSFIPFSEGPRNCIGERIAMIQLKITLAHIIRRFRIESKHKSLDEFEFISTVTMKIINNIDCRFIPR